MSQKICKIPILFVVGPTAVGKTAFSIELAKKLHGEIVSADSRYFYRGMDIGTAKPNIQERHGVPHHLIDVAEPDETWSLALFQKEAARIIEEISSRGMLPIVTGGTGQYVRAILEGWQAPEGEPDHRLREVLEDWGKDIGSQELHQKLSLLDPQAADLIDYRNMRRTVRALEVIFQSGEKFSAQRRQFESPYESIVLGLKRGRAELYARIDARIDLMIQNGLIDETEGLLKKGYSVDLPSMSAIGYKEAAGYLCGECSLTDSILLIKKRTHNYVRRQANWFKESDPNILWYDISEL